MIIGTAVEKPWTLYVFAPGALLDPWRNGFKSDGRFFAMDNL